MTAMSRSARTRANRRAGIRRSLPETARPDLPESHLTGIRNVGYQPHSKRSRRQYSGSGDTGYASDWAKPAHLPYRISAVTSDRRWDR